MFTLAFYEPGHFHAALTLKAANARINRKVHLYASPGPERSAFVALVESFNERSAAPTAWQVELHDSVDPLARLIADGFADAVILAGRNNAKLETIATLHAAGIAVFADKPWLVDSAAEPLLQSITKRGPLVMDIMTSRFDSLAQLRKAITLRPEVFGDFRRDAERPAIELGSVHHLYKQVNGAPLQRPSWYFDTSVQGDGLTDIQSHMIDQAQWLVDANALWTAPDVQLHQAERWPTMVPLQLYTDITGAPTFADEVLRCVNDTTLEYVCNGRIDFSLRGINICTEAQWGQIEPAGSGDLQRALVRGTRCDIELEHGPETDFAGYLHLVPHHGEGLRDALAAALPALHTQFPGLGFSTSSKGLRLELPVELRTTHESHFAMALDEFLDYLQAGCWPATIGPRICARYALVSAALKFAQTST
ncbi:MAG: putative dehydrogenase [Gammaproteobacteria bacterium]|jgi:predicted dehydrogenase